MDRSRTLALALIVVVTAVVIFVVAASVDTWRNRVDPQTVNQPPANQSMQQSSPQG